MKPAELLPQCVQLRQKIVVVPGVYLIYCDASGMGYIGSSNHVYRRLSAHRAQLNGKRHGSPHLQAAWSKYGAQTFRMLLLEARSGTTAELLALENAYLMAVDRELLFNTTVPAVIRRAVGVKNSPQTRAKMSASHKGKHTPATSKLTIEQVTEARQLYAEKKNEYGIITRLARRYQISIPAMWSVLKGVSWRNA
jgi:group I intron endonuclease